jgi:hypothetical protein
MSIIMLLKHYRFTCKRKPWHQHRLTARGLHSDAQWISLSYFKVHIASTVHFGTKMYNDQRNAKVFNLLINLLLPYMFWGLLLAHLQRQVYNFVVVQVT